MTTVACVLRSGGEYRAEHVRALAAGVGRHLPDARFVCLSDVPVPGVRTAPMQRPFPDWWSKINLFAPGAFLGRVLYVDLDSVIVGDLSDLAAYAGPFAMLSDFYRPAHTASGVMVWEAECAEARAIWHRFTDAPARGMRTRGGDQGFIRTVLGDDVARIQDFAPGQVCSYKVHVRDAGLSEPPDGARILAFHGKPRPWDTPLWRPAPPMAA